MWPVLSLKSREIDNFRDEEVTLRDVWPPISKNVVGWDISVIVSLFAWYFANAPAEKCCNYLIFKFGWFGFFASSCVSRSVKPYWICLFRDASAYGAFYAQACRIADQEE